MKKSKWWVRIAIAVAVLVVLAILMMFDPINSWVSGVINVPAQKIKSIAQVVVGAGIGYLLITTGVASLAIPVLGVALIVIGLAVIAYTVWPLFRPSTSNVG